jgi:hypothetical protein
MPGWSSTEVVTLSQLVAFLAFQIRVVIGLQALAARPVTRRTTDGLRRTHEPTESTLTHPHNTHPTAFTQAQLEWLPWLEPLPEAELTERHYAGLVDAVACQVAVLPAAGARPRHPGRPHPHRQGHLLQPRSRPAARRARALGRRGLALQRLHLLRVGACALCLAFLAAHGRCAAPARRRRGRRAGRALERDRGGVGRTVVDAVLLRGRTTSSLRAQGLDDLAIADVIHGAAFFNWANRLMLSLGEPPTA